MVPAGGGGLEWWERLAAGLRGWRGFGVLVRLQVVGVWVALPVVVVAVVVSSELRVSLGAWVGAVWVVAAWFWMARLKTVSWRLVAGVFALGMPWSVVVGWVCARVVEVAGVEVNDTAASLVVAGVVEELGKLVPLVLLALVAPGRVRRLLVCDWLLLGLAAGAAFTAVEEMARRMAYLSGSTGLGGLFQEVMCLGREADWLECMGMKTFGLSPVSGDAVAALPYGGHAVVTGLVAAGIGIARHGWWRAGLLRGLLARGVVRSVLVVVPVVGLWVVVVDHMGRNASTEFEAWSATGGSAPWPVVGVTSLLTGGGGGRGWLLLVVGVVGAVLDARVLEAGGYGDRLYEDVDVYRGRPGGGALGAWRWRTLAGLPATGWGRLLADVVDVLVLPVLEWRLVWRAAAVGKVFKRVSVPVATTVGLREVRGRAARAVLDPAGGGRWVTTGVAVCSAVAGVGVLMAVPGLTRELAYQLGEPVWQGWLAGVLDLLGAFWDGLSPVEQGLLMVVAGALVVVSGGTLGLAFNVGMGLALLGRADEAAGFVRDPRGTVRGYLATHTPGQIAMDAGLFVATEVAGGVMGRTAGLAARHARSELLESSLWRGESATALGRRPVYAGADPRRPSGLRQDGGTVYRTRTSGTQPADAPRPRAVPDWSDPAVRQQWFEGLETRTTAPNSEPIRYQHRVLGTDIERKLVADNGDSVIADAISPDGSVYVALDAKYTAGGPKAMYEGGAPDFLMLEFDEQMSTYEQVIRSSNNPVGRLVIVTNTPEAQAYLSARLAAILAPDTPFDVILIP